MPDRVWELIRALVLSIIEPTKYYGQYEYQVLGGTPALGFELMATDRKVAPDLPRVNFFASKPTWTTVLAPGARVLVGFVNGDRKRPFIAHDGAVIRNGDLGTALGTFVKT